LFCTARMGQSKGVSAFALTPLLYPTLLYSDQLEKRSFQIFLEGVTDRFVSSTIPDPFQEDGPATTPVFKMISV
jgi:hypothetical protein